MKRTAVVGDGFDVDVLYGMFAPSAVFDAIVAIIVGAAIVTVVSIAI